MEQACIQLYINTQQQNSESKTFSYGICRGDLQTSYIPEKEVHHPWVFEKMQCTCEDDIIIIIILLLLLYLEPVQLILCHPSTAR